MSVSETLKTRNGIKRFLLPEGFGSGIVLAFEYADKRTEAHLLKQECAPLYLEENTKFALIDGEQIGAYLLAVTPNAKQGRNGCLVFKAWDAASVLGFTPKEIQINDNDRIFTQDGKFRCQLNLLENLSDQSVFKIDSHGSLVALLVENQILIWKAIKKDQNTLSLQFFHRIKPKPGHIAFDVVVLQFNGEYMLCVVENGGFSLWNLNESGVLVSKTISFAARSLCLSTQKFHRITTSKVVFSDDNGELWVLCLGSQSLSNIRLPGLKGECNVFAINSHQNDNPGLLAVCSEGHTVNIYSFDEKTMEDFRETVQLHRPLKILFSAVPVDALVFLKKDTLALASTSNRTFTIWTGITEVRS